MSMPKRDLLSRHFQKKISEFCEVRIAPISSRRLLENVRPYLISLIICRKRPPILNGHLDWTAIGKACGIEDKMTAELKKQLRLGLDAILRWLKAPPVSEDAPAAKPSAHASKAEPVKRQRQLPRPENRNARPQTELLPGTHLRNAVLRQSRSAHSRIRYSRQPTIRRAFRMRSFTIRRFGDSYWQLYRAVVRLTETFDSKTLLSWIQGERAPLSVASFDILRRIEMRYRLPEGYFKAKLPHQARSLYGHDLGDISPAERRRISLHLPDDFRSLPFTKREEILDWVRRVIISG